MPEIVLNTREDFFLVIKTVKKKKIDFEAKILQAFLTTFSVDYFSFDVENRIGFHQIGGGFYLFFFSGLHLESKSLASHFRDAMLFSMTILGRWLLFLETCSRSFLPVAMHTQPCKWLVALRKVSTVHFNKFGTTNENLSHVTNENGMQKTVNNRYGRCYWSVWNCKLRCLYYFCLLSTKVYIDRRQWKAIEQYLSKTQT